MSIYWKWTEEYDTLLSLAGSDSKLTPAHLIAEAIVEKIIGDNSSALCFLHSKRKLDEELIAAFKEDREEGTLKDLSRHEDLDTVEWEKRIRENAHIYYVLTLNKSKRNSTHLLTPHFHRIYPGKGQFNLFLHCHDTVEESERSVLEYSTSYDPNENRLYDKSSGDDWLTQDLSKLIGRPTGIVADHCFVLNPPTYFDLFEFSTDMIDFISPNKLNQMEKMMEFSIELANNMPHITHGIYQHHLTETQMRDRMNRIKLHFKGE